jgi:hypothetical protein
MLYMQEQEMSFEEKSTWIYGVLAVALPLVYFATVIGQAQTTAVTEIAYQGRLLAAIGAAIVLAIVAHIAVAMSSPKDAGKADQRDKDINRFGEYVGGIVLSVFVLVPFVLAMAEVDHFWIANSIYLAFIASAIAATAVKLVAYRRGF